MVQRYDSSVVDRLVGRPGVFSFASDLAARTRAFLHRHSYDPPVLSSELQLWRLVCLLMAVLLLTFGAVYMQAGTAPRYVLWPELALSFIALMTLATSYSSAYVRDHFALALRGLCYLSAGWFVVLASDGAFLPNFAVGLLFVIPGLGVGYSVTLRSIGPLALFFTVTVAAASAACIAFGGSSIDPALFIASLVSIALVTLFVAAGRLDAQKQFHAIEERYHAVVEQASDGIYLLDAETLAFLDANPAFCRMIGRSLDDLRSRSVKDLVVSCCDEATGRCCHSFRGRHAHLSERMLRRADGSIIYVELHIDRIRYADREVLSVVVHDVSSRKEYEERLVKAKEKAEEISTFKSSLLANMSHEIRTPLCSILGWATVLNDELPDNHRELIKLIEDSGQRLHHTLDTVLELAQLDANSKTLQPTLVNVPAEVREIGERARMRVETKGLSLFIDTCGQPVFARLDVSCLRRILMHILDNAVKFTCSGSIRLSVSVSNAQVWIDVEDTGVGISEEFLPSIFDDFKQESAGLNRAHEGNGLGLAITKRLVDLLGGTIGVRSTQGKGSTVSLCFPEAVEAPRSVLAADRKPAGQAPWLSA